MELGSQGLKWVGAWRQPSQHEPFVDWPDAEIRLEAMGRRRLLLTIASPRKTPLSLSAIRTVVFVPFEHPNEVLVHHPALPRMKGVGAMRAGESWTEPPRSDLAADHHFAMRPGEPPFGMPPLVVLAEPGGPRFLAAAFRETHARMAIDWTVVEGGVEVGFTWTRWGRASYPTSREWPLESVLLAYEKKPGVLAAMDGSWLGSLHLHASLNRVLVGLGQLRRTGPLVRNELMWGSWNDGIYRDIDEARILETAAWLKANAPNVKWIQIDDGWAPVPDPEAPMSDFGAFYDSARLNEDPRFPNGLAGLARKIRAMGLRPMLWITPAVHERSLLYREKPDWFQPETRLFFMPELRFLDTSVPQVRELIEGAFHTAFREWGFEGCKLDFWTMGFDQPDIGYRDPEADGVSEMKWFVGALRRHLPNDGLLLHCIDIPFGSPFRSIGFDAFRYYADSEGSCQDLAKMKEQALWAAYLVGLYRAQASWIPDGDGLGLFRHFEMPENHFTLWLAFLAGSGTLVELAGWLHAADGDPRRDQILKALPHVRHGSIVQLPGFDFAQRDGEPPRVWIRRDGVRQLLVALTNWGTNPMHWTPGPEFVSTEPLEDVLTGESFERTAEIGVDAESGRLLVQR